MALELLGLIPSLTMGVLGSALLLTGRRLRFGLPYGIREGWPLRVFGLVYFAAGIYFTSRVVQGSSEQDALIGAYVSLALGVFASVGQWRKGRAREAVGPQP